MKSKSRKFLIIYSLSKNQQKAKQKFSWNLLLLGYGKCSEYIVFMLGTLRQKCLNAEFFLVCVFLYSYWLQENTDQKNSVFGHFSRSGGFWKTPTGRDHYYYLFLFAMWIYLEFFNMLRNLGRIFFAVALVGCFLRILNKQGHLLKKNEVSQDVFHPGTKYLYGKYCFSYSRILLDRDG